MRQYLQATIILSFTDEWGDNISRDRVRDGHQRHMMDDREQLMDWARDVTGDPDVELTMVEVK